MTSPVSERPLPMTSPVSERPLPMTSPVSTRPWPSAPAPLAMPSTTKAPPPTTCPPTLRSPSPTLLMSLVRFSRISFWKSRMISLSSPEAHSRASAPIVPLNASSSHDLNLKGFALTARMWMFQSTNSRRRSSRTSLRRFLFSSSVSSGGFWFTRSSRVMSALSLFVTSAPAAWIPPATELPRLAARLFTSASCFSISALAPAKASPTELNRDTSPSGSFALSRFAASSAMRFSSCSRSSAASSAARSFAASAALCRFRFWKLRIFFVESAPALGSGTSSTYTVAPVTLMTSTSPHRYPTTKLPRPRTPRMLNGLSLTCTRFMATRNGDENRAVGGLPSVKSSTVTVPCPPATRTLTAPTKTSPASFARIFVSTFLVTNASNRASSAVLFVSASEATETSSAASAVTIFSHGSCAQNRAARPSHRTFASGLYGSSITYTSAAACERSAAAWSTASAMADESIAPIVRPRASNYAVRRSPTWTKRTTEKSPRFFCHLHTRGRGGVR